MQRVKALNLFLADIYGAQEIVKAGRIPADLVSRNAEFRPEMVWLAGFRTIFTFISPASMCPHRRGRFLRARRQCAHSFGVSYMLENREVMMRVAPDLSPTIASPRRELSRCPSRRFAFAGAASSHGRANHRGVDARPVQFRLYEHSFLADKLGVELVEGSDLLVEDRIVYMRTTQGEKRVDVIYRRIDDSFLDPQVFRADSIIGVAGLMDAYRRAM